ncbi:MAG: hypothetical protein Q4G21_04420 [Dermabacter sp.]|nr:hypothetical protein [Dermabacter sp.]
MGNALTNEVRLASRLATKARTEAISTPTPATLTELARHLRVLAALSDDEIRSIDDISRLLAAACLDDLRDALTERDLDEHRDLMARASHRLTSAHPPAPSEGPDSHVPRALAA